MVCGGRRFSIGIPTMGVAWQWINPSRTQRGSLEPEIETNHRRPQLLAAGSNESSSGR